ncbi:hypothetical protein CANCADRAFT_4590 [Tortispora caseinolytica NRRL Y-17796]|uniref:Cytochrome c oxidase subunit 8, mitochondrial n=1 Tax=Tortispora caseinolytica NRRL Y-17796 TaxID=767744 RepID=A0A1E4T9L9_9ASCO|nr:hypothetical protein CANCADRAFT_4590 [Tortispora caseinolytica NRRL Y-17796]
MKIYLIIGSVRLGRIGPQIAEWIKKEIQANDPSSDIELIDLREWYLPMDDEPNLPASGHYEKEHTKAWARKISQGEMFIFLTPQYNGGYPAALKNAIDHLYAEWSGKPACIVSYAYRGGGRAAAQLKQILTGVRMLTQENAVEISLSQLVVDDSGCITDIENALSQYKQAMFRAGRASGNRQFSSNAVRRSDHYEEGVYSNIPFKIHNRKYVPYWVLHFGFLGLGFFAPFLVAYYQMKRSGSI